MAMQKLSIAGLNANFEQLLRKFPEERRALFARLEPKLVDMVRGVIGGSGKVASWQVGALGSLGAYTAVHPKPKTFYSAREGGKKYAVGYITNAITSGHKSRSGDRVLGKHYYEDATELAKSILEQEVQTFERRLKEMVEE